MKTKPVAEKLTWDRLLGSALRRLGRPIDRAFARRHPSAFERKLIRLAAPLVRLMEPNDKWSLGVHAPMWARAAADAPVRFAAESPKRIFLWCCYRGQFSLELSHAAMLAAIGHRVTVGYLPKLGSPIKNPLVDDPSAPDYLADALGTVEDVSQGRIRIVCFAGIEAPPGYAVDSRLLDQQAHADSIMRLGVESIDEQRPDHAEALRYYRELSESIDRRAQGFFANFKGAFDLVLLGNGMTSESSWILRAAKKYGFEVATFEKFAFRHTRIVSHGDTVFSFSDLDRMWRRRAELGYVSQPFMARAVGKAHQILDERRRAVTKNWALKYQFAPNQSDEAALAAIDLSPTKPYILICTNVPYDAGYYQFTTLFPSMKAWLLETVAFLLEWTSCEIVVRIHPGEAIHQSVKEYSLDNLAEAGLTSQPRVRIVGPKDAVNSYPLMANCQAGVVFSSTTAIEMAMMGRPVIVGSDVYFAKRGFTHDCPSREVYFETLREFASLPARGADDPQTAERAALLYFLVHFALQLPYPYDKGIDLRRLPPTQALRAPDFEKFLPFFAIATATGDEIDAAFDKYLHADCLQARVPW